MVLIRGIVFIHEAVRDWEAKLAPLLSEDLRKRRIGKAGRCWHVDERLPTSTTRFGSVSLQVRTTIGCSSDVVKSL
jgi:hypothetical protein